MLKKKIASGTTEGFKNVKQSIIPMGGRGGLQPHKV